ncbi:MAG: response regulator [Firmicutes bacterium]|nr:response regulator [Bacillota bacterium]
MFRVMVVAPQTQCCEWVAECLREQPDLAYVGCETSLGDALSAVTVLKPHVVLLDLDSADWSGRAVLHEFRKQWPKQPAVIVLSHLGDDDAVGEANHLGADYYMVKPVRSDVLVRRIRQIAAMANGASFSAANAVDSIRDKAVEYFQRIGMPSHLKGYRYLIEAMVLVVPDHSLTSQVTKKLYPLIAERFETTPIRVERAIRNAIEITWERGDITQVNQLFSYVDENRGKPTNSAFIAGMADIISLDLS